MSAMSDELEGNQIDASEQIAEYAKLKNLQLTEAKRFYGMLNKFNQESNIEERRRAIETSNLTTQQKLQQMEELNQQIALNEQRAYKATITYRENLMQMYTANERQEHFRSAQVQEQRYRDEAKKTCMARIEAALASGKQQEEIDAEIAEARKKYEEDAIASIGRETEARRAARKDEDESASKVPQREVSESDAAKIKTMQKFKALAGGPAAAIDNKLKETEGAANKARERKEDIQRKMSELDPNNAVDREMLEQLQEEFIEANKEAVKAGNAEAAAKTAKAISSALNSAYKDAFSKAENMLTSYQAHIDARLQGSDKSYKEITGKVTSVLSTSPYVKSVDVLEKLREATDQGIVYNLEQRAFLATISDKIANTFDAFDSNLLRLIRLQQADTTAARLGMEASLTKFFNSMFNDSSYLTNAADTVAAALLEASSLMDKNTATEFEYIVQKWLGSLSSLGMDTNTINKIAEGVNYIATGNVTSLANNSSLQTLFAMSASNANLEYSELLLNGLDISSTNDLLRSMVEYLKTIAEESENNVVRSAYADIFEMSVADMRAISNLTESEIDNIHSMVMSYGNMEGELNTQLQQLSSRISLASKLTNVYENVVYGVASDMVSNPATWGMQKMLDFMVENGVNFNIPFINAMGYGLDINAGVTDLLQLAVGATQATMLVTNLLSGLGSDGGRDLDSWGGTEYNQRGDGFNFSAYSTLGGTSGSSYVANSSTDDQNTSAISSATDEAEDTGKITGKNQEVPEKTTDDFYEAIIGENATDYVKIRDDTMWNVYDESGKFLRVQDSRFSFDGENLKVVDSKNSTADIHLDMLNILEFLKVDLYTVLSTKIGTTNNNKSEDPIKQAMDTTSQALRVIVKTDTTSNVLHVSDSQLTDISSKLSEIHTLLSKPKEETSTVKLADNTMVDIKKETLIAALKDALYDGKDNSIIGLIDTITNGNLTVKNISESVAVKTPPGEKLSVSNLVW